jgi:NAD(P)-dependent dehydrogenase (short-subunit alcohol dehydrogenase family)
VAIVTGATKGLGRSMAEGLAGAGASIVVVSRDQDACSRVADEITASTGRAALGVASHMGEWDALPALVETVRDRFGRIDILVNNAGINPAPTSVIDMSEEYLDKLFAVNMKGPVRLAGLVAPVMAERAKGSVINVSTVGAYAGGANFGAYTSAKAALINFTKVMAKEWASMGIRVNAISPGPFNSTMMQGAAKLDPEFSTHRSSPARITWWPAGCCAHDAAHVPARRQGRADNRREQRSGAGHGAGVRRGRGRRGRGQSQGRRL